MLPLADVSFGDLLLLIFEMFLFIVWIWILFTIISDLFRNHDMSGGLKAVWIILLVLIPYISALVYLIIYGNDMRERQLRAQAEAKHAADDSIPSPPPSPPAAELPNLHNP